MNFIAKTFIGAIAALCTAVAFAAIDVNKANQAELESIKGIGPSMSTRILDARKSGAFKDWADLASRVKGVGSGNAKKYSADGMTVNGVAYVAPAAAADKPASRKAAKADAAPRGGKADSASHAAK
ncbi:MAG: helix-hairpin-helix domain-containing protein [Proteobacteria bacterium]|nr:helix-hairpin-helix domain-containing protein [Pseudomonadota bacterium]